MDDIAKKERVTLETDKYSVYTEEGIKRSKRHKLNSEKNDHEPYSALNATHIRILDMAATGMRRREIVNTLRNEGIKVHENTVGYIINSELGRMRIKELQEKYTDQILIDADEHRRMAHEAQNLLRQSMHGVLSTPCIDPETQEVARDEEGNIIFRDENVEVKDRLASAKAIAATHADTAPIQRQKITKGQGGPDEGVLQKVRERMESAILTQAEEVPRLETDNA